MTLPCDTNGDGVPDSREFAGSHRYNTAVALAMSFAEDEGSISTVILASGESQVDAVTAAGLAGNLNAAVMLTRSNQLPHNVARFIDEHNITDVLVVGGPAAVPDAIVTAVEGLGSRPNVERVSGADRYATAAAIGDRLGGPNPTWCGSDQSAAIMVNGGDAGRADAIIAGPLAFRLGLPVLLTDADEIPDSTSSFLTDNKVERVVIIGGAGAVSAGVVNTLVEDVGVVNVQRISGGSAAATSVAVAQEMLGNCAEVLGTDRDRVALVNRDAIADGITSAPVLGRGLGEDGGSIPILLVGDELPAAVRDYLAGTAEVRGGKKTHQRILAIGGAAVVSSAVMAEAVAAAKTSAGLTAEIKVAKNATGTAYESWSCDHDDSDATDDVVCGGVFTVTFSDDVKLPEDGDDSDEIAGSTTAELVGTALDPTLYRLNGRRIEALHAVNPRLAPAPTGTDEELIGYSDLVFTADRTVKIYLSHVLEPNDEIMVVGGGKIGAKDDQRKLESSELKLGTLASSADRAAPMVEIIAHDGAQSFVVYVTEPNMLHNELESATEWDKFVKVDGKGTKAFSDLQPPSDTFAANERRGVHERFTVALADGETLGVGDVITVERKAFLDKGGRGNSLRRHTVTAHKAQDTFEVSSVSIGDYVHTAQATAELVAVAPDEGDKLIIGAKKSGIADGAAGNGWVIYGYDDRPDSDAAADGVQNGNMFNIRVAVDSANRVISYTISQTAPPTPLPAGKDGPTLGDLAVALVSNDTFAANFTVSYDDPAEQRKNSALGGTDASGAHFGDDIGDGSEKAGMTAVGVVVRFNDIVQFLTATTDGAASDDGAALAASLAPADGATGTVNFMAPDNVVHISYASPNLAALPKRAGFRVIPAGIATSYNADGNGDGTADDSARNIREILNSLRPDSSIKP